MDVDVLLASFVGECDALRFKAGDFETSQC